MSSDLEKESQRSQNDSRTRPFDRSVSVDHPCTPKGSNGAGIAPEDDEKYFTVTWDGDQDPEDPKSMSKARKWLIVIIVSFTSFCVTCNSTVYTTTYDQLDPRFHTSREVATLGLSTFVFGLMAGPLLLAPLSEFYGRRMVYIGSISLVLIFIIPCAVAQNIETILVTRFFDGFFGSAFLSVAGGTVGDVFVKSELSLPMMVYSGSPFIGPAIGPLIGGFISQFTTWRW